MRKIIYAFVIGIFLIVLKAFYFDTQSQTISSDNNIPIENPVEKSTANQNLNQMPLQNATHKPIIPPETSKFKCDCRIHCSQMRSCDEAIFFLENCPGTKMDGNGDGIPCESQWCL